MGAVLIDVHDEWIAGDRRYLSEESMALLNTTVDTGCPRRHHQRRVGHRGPPQSHQGPGLCRSRLLVGPTAIE